MNARTSFEQEPAENRTSSREEPRQLLYDHSERTLETTMLRRAQESILSDLNTMPVGVDSTVRFLNKYDLAACRDKKNTDEGHNPKLRLEIIGFSSPKSSLPKPN